MKTCEHCGALIEFPGDHSDWCPQHPTVMERRTHALLQAAAVLYASIGGEDTLMATMVAEDILAEIERPEKEGT